MDLKDFTTTLYSRKNLYSSFDPNFLPNFVFLAYGRNRLSVVMRNHEFPRAYHYLSTLITLERNIAVLGEINEP